MIKPKLIIRSNHLGMLRTKLPGAVSDENRKTANEMLKYMRNRMLAQSSPSAPGEYPAVVTGRVINGLYIDEEKGIVRSSVVVVSPAPESKFLEYGTAYMAPRSFLRPTARRFFPQHTSRMRTLIKRLLSGIR